MISETLPTAAFYGSDGLKRPLLMTIAGASGTDFGLLIVAKALVDAQVYQFSGFSLAADKLVLVSSVNPKAHMEFTDFDPGVLDAVREVKTLIIAYHEASSVDKDSFDIDPVVTLPRINS